MIIVATTLFTLHLHKTVVVVVEMQTHTIVRPPVIRPSVRHVTSRPIEAGKQLAVLSVGQLNDVLQLMVVGTLDLHRGTMKTINGRTTPAAAAATAAYEERRGEVGWSGVGWGRERENPHSAKAATRRVMGTAAAAAAAVAAALGRGDGQRTRCTSGSPSPPLPSLPSSPLHV